MTDNDEELAFWLLVGLCEGYGLEGMWSDGMPRLKLCFHVLDRMMALRTPALHAHFQVAFDVDNGGARYLFSHAWPGYECTQTTRERKDREQSVLTCPLTIIGCRRSVACTLPQDDLTSPSLDATLVLCRRSVACTWPCSAASGS